MKKIYHLSTCDTCKRIIKEVGFPDDFEFQDIKFNKITEFQIDEMKNLAGSFEALFSRRARNYKAFGLANKNLSDIDIRNYILKDYTFLKRPVVIIDDSIFIGNSINNVEQVKNCLK